MADKKTAPSFSVALSKWRDMSALFPKPWPEVAALIDIEYLKSGDSPTIGRRKLARRWGWTERQTRTLLETLNISLCKRPALRPANAAQLLEITKPTVPPPSQKEAQHAPTDDCAEVAVFEVWAALKEKDTGRLQRFTRGRRRVTRAALKDYSAEDLILVVRFAFEYPYEDTLTSHWRKSKYMDLVNLINSRTVDRNVTRAKELWSGTGWIPQEGVDDNNDTAWEYMIGLIADYPSQPDPLHHDPMSDYALRLALDDVGGWERVGGTRKGYALDQIKKRFIRVAAAAYQSYADTQQPMLIPLDGER